jgi:hypothetical protein
MSGVSKARQETPFWWIIARTCLLSVAGALLIAAVAQPLVDSANSGPVQRCQSLGAEPVYGRLWVSFCEMPDGSIVAVPDKEKG